MPRGPVVASPVPGAVPQNPGDVIQSSVWNATVDDIYNIFNTIQPIEYGGNGVSDGKPLDNSFGIRNNVDATKLAIFSATSIPTATTLTYALPSTSGTLALTSDIAQKGYIYGLTLANNTTDATNDIDIAAGSAADSTGSALLSLATIITKRLDAAWAVGNGNGFLDTGAIANTTYHVFLIRRPDTGIVDVLASASPSAPTLPVNYTQFRRIGSILRASGVIVPFSQNGDEFLRVNTILDVAANNPGTLAVTRTLSVPTGIVVGAMFSALARNVANNFSFDTYFSSLVQADEVVGQIVAPLSQTGGSYTIAGGSTLAASGNLTIRTNTSAQIRTRALGSDANCTLYISTYGWIDTRGK